MAGTVAGQPHAPAAARSMTIRSARSASTPAASWSSRPSKSSAATTPIPAASFAARSAFYMIAPEMLAASDWTRHSVVVDLRGSFTGYGQHLPAAPGADLRRRRPTSTARIHRQDRRPHRRVSRDTRINTECAPACRHRQSRQPEHPGRAERISAATPRPAARSASSRISTGCGLTRDRQCRPHRLSESEAHQRRHRPPTTTATSTSMAASAASATN